MTELQRYYGAMVGTLCGDALGAPYEWKSPEEISADMQQRGGTDPNAYKPFDYIDPWKKQRLISKGQPTDDSELAAALGRSLASGTVFDPAHTYEHLRSFIHGRKSILTETAYGTGGTLRAALAPPTYEESVSKFSNGEIPTPPSNGSLMRCIAVPLRTFPHIHRAIELAEQQSIITHRNPSAVAACIAYSVLVRFVLCEVPPADAWKKTIEVLKNIPSRMNPAMEEVLAIKLTGPEYHAEMKNKEGWVVLSLRIAVWASATATSFADGIMKSIGVGGDTDTYAAIAGGILGAHFGILGIPPAWRAVLQGQDVMLEIADTLYNISHP